MIPRSDIEILAFRIEFLQPDGRWTGPYCAEWMTEAGFTCRDAMIEAHRDSPGHPWPDAAIFAANPGPDRHVCASLSRSGLRRWFGEFLVPLFGCGGHLATYAVPWASIASVDARQIVYRQADAHLLHRCGVAPVDPLSERIHPTKAVTS